MILLRINIRVLFIDTVHRNNSMFTREPRELQGYRSSLLHNLRGTLNPKYLRFGVFNCFVFEIYFEII